MISHTNLPVPFWGYDLETVTFILNRAPSKFVKTTPYEMWHDKKSKLSFLRIWGCEAYVKKLQPNKLEPKADKCIFVGYPKETIGYTFYNKAEGKPFVAKAEHFLEKDFLAKGVGGRKIDLDDIVDPPLSTEGTTMEVVSEPSFIVGVEENDNDHDDHIEEPTLPRRSTRKCKATEFYSNQFNIVMLVEHDEPANYKEEMEDPESEKWLEAMRSEIDSMYANKVWTLVNIPEDQKAIENKWIIKKNTDADGNVSIYKA